jgi:hypothetical protein
MALYYQAPRYQIYSHDSCEGQGLRTFYSNIATPVALRICKESRDETGKLSPISLGQPIIQQTSAFGLLLDTTLAEKYFSAMPALEREIVVVDDATYDITGGRLWHLRPEDSRIELYENWDSLTGFNLAAYRQCLQNHRDKYKSMLRRRIELRFGIRKPVTRLLGVQGVRYHLDSGYHYSESVSRS